MSCCRSCFNLHSTSPPWYISPTYPISWNRGSFFHPSVRKTDLVKRREVIDLEAKFEPSLLNTAIYLLGLSQQVSTFAINYQGRPFREGIRENPALYWGLVGAAAVAFSGSTDFMPELNRWLQIVEMEGHVSGLGPIKHHCVLTHFYSSSLS